MPSKSKAQHNFMEMVAHSKKGDATISKKVAKDFVQADKQRGKTALRKLPQKKK